ncbi:cysteine proteinase [Stereum hirsutum FP-91666 SS1]|uniref:cysteine proteinase n=1 Tax=Stereum hirsutum (strain FP-91666) TaxID=721885 RepID=UPI000440D08A|nr:cysteine proteinase [Stereum hirsutum FP-91666 SS1]EIM91186.1 cysteine proteinase [Stereum hirsutum FP-91666 SS1]
MQPTELTGRPRINKAGLIVTAELDQAISRCRSKVQKLAKDCRRGNRRYRRVHFRRLPTDTLISCAEFDACRRDIDFDLLEDRDNCLHGIIVEPNPKKYTPTEALRVTQIFHDPKFFVDGATASDIAQGYLGDCWFLSALAVVATAGLIEQICVERDEKVGIYGFIFWRDSGWVDVIIDDLLFVKVPRWTALTDREHMLYKNDQDAYAKDARKGSKALYFGKSREENETWVPLIEKAYAKLHGDYASLEGGYTNEAVEDLTGAVSTLMYTQDILDPDEFWKSELLNVREDRAFACYNPNTMNMTGTTLTNGLVVNHTYSVIKAIEFNGKRFLKVRNPWGMYEWTGRWSDGSKEWEGQWLEALSALDYKFGDDGEFIMEYSDFLQAWDVVEKCRLFDEQWSCSQLWLLANLATYPRPTNYGDVSFTFSLSKDTDAVIVLAQLDTRYFRGLSSHYTFSLHCQIFKEGQDDPVSMSTHNKFWDRSVNLEAFLEAGDYVVQVPNFS